MKKFLLMTFMLLPAVLCSEELKFVTVLSSPVGTFNRVEEVDSQTPVTSPVINFCTKLGSGNVQLNGRGNPSAAKLNLASNAELGGNVSEYRLQTLTMRYGGTLKGSRLLANTVNANTTPTLIKSSDIYASTLNVQGAKTVGLNVGNGKSVMSGTESNREMVWSNEYQQDKNGTTSTDYAKQFLLKEKGAACVVSYGSWGSGSLSEADTCDGNSSAAFTCTPGVAKTCVDIFADNTSSYTEGVETDYPNDECPGNNTADQYICDGSFSGSCVDVYDDFMKGRWDDTSTDTLTVSCINNSLQNGGGWCPNYGYGLRYYSADEVCAEEEKWGAHVLPGESFTCGIAREDLQDVCSSVGWGSNIDYYHPHWLVCEHLPKERTVTCGGVKKRTVQCC